MDSRDTHPANFVVKDNGQREQLGGGMVRSPAADKTNMLLAFDGPMLRRYAAHMTKGARVYGVRNWLKIQNASAEEKANALQRAHESLARHFTQYIAGEIDEDHAAAIVFNLNLVELIKGCS